MLNRHRTRHPNRRLALALMVPLLNGAWAGCSSKPAADDDAALMKAGLEALQMRHDPETAIADFRPTGRRDGGMSTQSRDVRLCPK